MDLIKCYQILGVSRDCTWEELRTAYRRQVQKHHPDRYQQQPDRQHIAKERMLELNKAFDTLEEYYKKNGHLPVNDLKKVSNETPVQTRSRPTSYKTKDKTTYVAPEITPLKTPKQAARRTSWGLLIVVATLGYYFFWEGTPEPANPSSGNPYYEGNNITGDGTLNSPSTARLPEDIDNKRIETAPGLDKQLAPSPNLAPLGMQGKIQEGPFFTYGDTPGKVFEVQGIPTRTVGDIWFYGTSEVHFNRGVVVSWYNSPAYPLKAK